MTDELPGFPCVICGKLAAKNDPRCVSCGHSFMGEWRLLGGGRRDLTWADRCVILFLGLLSFLNLLGLLGVLISVFSGEAFEGPGSSWQDQVMTYGLVVSTLTATATSIITAVGFARGQRWAWWSALVLFGLALVECAVLIVFLLMQSAGALAIMILIPAALCLFPLRALRETRDRMADRARRDQGPISAPKP